MRGTAEIPENWSGRRDSNPRPQPWQGCALPLSYARAPAVGGRIIRIEPRFATPGLAALRRPGSSAKSKPEFLMGTAVAPDRICPQARKMEERDAVPSRKPADAV